MHGCISFCILNTSLWITRVNRETEGRNYLEFLYTQVFHRRVFLFILTLFVKFQQRARGRETGRARKKERERAHLISRHVENAAPNFLLFICCSSLVCPSFVALFASYLRLLPFGFLFLICWHALAFRFSFPLSFVCTFIYLAYFAFDFRHFVTDFNSNAETLFGLD